MHLAQTMVSDSPKINAIEYLQQSCEFGMTFQFSVDSTLDSDAIDETYRLGCELRRTNWTQVDFFR